MAIIETNKTTLERYNGRILYEVKETYTDGSSYYGYYVEQPNKSIYKAQGYRYKTVSSNQEVDIEDEKALEKAKHILHNGFPF